MTTLKSCMGAALRPLSTSLRLRVAAGVLAGVMVVFRSKRGDRIKVLFWDGSGIVMIYKRLEQGEDAALDDVHDGTDAEETEDDAHEQRDERGDDEIEHVRHDIMQFLLEVRRDNRNRESRQDRPLVAHDRYDKTEEVELDGLGRPGRDAVRVG